MENLKIRIATEEESERAQRAFFALGYRWYPEDHVEPNGICPLDIEIIVGDNDKEINIYRNVKGFDAIFATAVTLPELEEMAAKAAHGEGLNSFETMVAEKEQATTYDPNTVRSNESEWQEFLRDADKAQSNALITNRSNAVISLLGELIHSGLLSESLKSDCEVQVRGLKRVIYINNIEAQKRYEAALEYIEKNKGYELCDYIDAVQQALRIAAGME
jgi:hypothetical protein